MQFHIRETYPNKKVGYVVQSRIAVLVIALAFCCGGCAVLPDTPQSLAAATQDSYAQSSPIADGPAAPPPPGFVSLCTREPEACDAPLPADAAKVAIDKNVATLLVSVNTRVNDAIVYESDKAHYDVVDRWTLDPQDGRGDCKAYALAKQEALRAAGLPEAALRIGIVRTPENELHAVLTVDTDKGVLVMDSLTPEILPWSDTPYQWLMRQAADNPLHWVTLADGS